MKSADCSGKPVSEFDHPTCRRTRAALTAAAFAFAMRLLQFQRALQSPAGDLNLCLDAAFVCPRQDCGRKRISQQIETVGELQNVSVKKGMHSRTPGRNGGPIVLVRDLPSCGRDG